MRKILIIVILFFVSVSFSYAATTGSINSTNPNAKYAKILSGPHAGTQINFRPNDTSSSIPITIFTNRIVGYAWGEATGWIVFSCESTTSGCNSLNDNFKVTNDGAGHLSGYAWGEATGWISFNCVNATSSCLTDAGSWGVSIVNGNFDGYAWSQNFGWIQFDCNVSGACVNTDWAPASTPSAVVPTYILQIISDNTRAEEDKIISRIIPSSKELLPSHSTNSIAKVIPKIENQPPLNYNPYKSVPPPPKSNNKTLIKRPSYKKVVNPKCKSLVNLPTDQIMASMLNIDLQKNMLPVTSIDCDVKDQYQIDLDNKKIKIEKNIKKFMNILNRGINNLNIRIKSPYNK